MDELTPATLALAALPDGIVLFDGQGRLSLINAAAQELLALDAESCLGRTFEEFAGMVGLPVKVGLQKRQVERGDTICFVQTLCLPSESSASDLSLGLRFTKGVEEIALAHELISTLHFEVRAPLTVIRGMAELLAREIVAPLPEPLREFPPIMERNARLIQHNLAQCLTLARLRRAPIHDAERTVDVAELVRGELREAQQILERLGAPRSCIVELPDTPLFATTHDSPLREALQQLIDNAYRFTPADGQITVRAWAELERVVIAISDTGPGIPIDKHPLVFQRRFYTGTEPVPPLTSGAGLGLLIVQACVEQSTFTVAFESEEGKGTTFHISIARRHLV